MKIYTYHLRPGQTPLEAVVAVPEGFSPGASLFGALWALYRRLWLFGAILVAVQAAVFLTVSRLGLDPMLGAAMMAGVAVYAGCSGNDWRRERLERNGYLLAGIAVGRDREEAERRFFDRLRDRAASLGDDAPSHTGTAPA